MHNEESPFEDELRVSLRRVEVPAEFAGKVLRAVEEEQGWAAGTGDLKRPDGPAGKTRFGVHGQAVHGHTAGGQAAAFVRLLRFSRVPGLTISPAFAAALVLMLLLPLGNYVYRRHQQAQAQAAARQFVLAMRLTQAALQDAAEHVQAHAHPGNTE